VFTVQGYIDGTAYGIAVGTDDGEAVADGERAGIAVGSPSAIGLLQAAVGGDYRPGPTVAARRLDLEDDASILAALMALTEVTSVAGDAPDLTGIEPVEVDATY
jgi:hypothetical protein